MKAIAFIGAIMGASFILGICSVPRHQDPVPPVKIIWGDEAEVGVGGENTSAPNPDTSRRWNVRDIECLAQNIYHEARGEPVAGQVAVAYVVLNRVARRIRGTDVCEVVWAPHQFSWTRHPTPIRDAQAWRQAWQQACLRPRDRFWDIPVPKIDSAFDNLFVPQPSWSPSTTQQLRKLVAAPYLSPNDWTPRSDAYFASPLALCARRVSSAASRLLGTTSLRFALHGW